MFAYLTAGLFAQIVSLCVGINIYPNEKKHLQVNSKGIVPQSASRNDPGTGAVQTALLSQAFYMNLDRSVERRTFMEAELKSLQKYSSGRFNFERFPAANTSHPWVLSRIDAWRNGSDEEKHLIQGLREDEIQPTIACYFTHLLTWKRAAEQVTKQTNASRFVLFLEDDADLKFTSLDSLVSELSMVPDDADVVVLGTFGSVRPSDIASSGIDAYLYRASGPFTQRLNSHEYYLAVWESRHSDDRATQIHATLFYAGMHAYLLRTSKLPQLIHYLEHEKTSYLVDEGTAWNSTGMRKYVLYPPFATQFYDLGTARNSTQQQKKTAQGGCSHRYSFTSLCHAGAILSLLVLRALHGPT